MKKFTFFTARPNQGTAWVQVGSAVHFTRQQLQRYFKPVYLLSFSAESPLNKSMIYMQYLAKEN